MKDKFVKNDLHPFRYRTSRKFISEFLTLFQKKVGLADITEQTLNFFSGKFIEVYNREVMKLSFDERPIQAAGAINFELSMFLHYARFYVNGQNVFRPTPYLVELLKHTDVSDVVLSEIKLPFKTFYLSFGKNQNWTLDSPENIIDGAYINLLTGEPNGMDWRVLEIMLTSFNSNSYNPRKNFVQNPNIYYYFSFKYEANENKPLRELLEESLLEEFKDISSKDFDLSKLDTPELEEFTDEEISYLKENVEVDSFSPFYTTNASFNEDGKIVISKSDRPSSEFIRRKFVRENFDRFVSALKLIVNLICYVNAEPADLQETYPNDAPQNKVEQYEQTEKSASKRRIEQQLQMAGYTRIKILGGQFEGEAKETYQNATDSIKGEKSAHWRRGHWRKQAHGAQNHERRLKFIKPMLIRADKGMPEKGHIYTLEESKKFNEN